MSHYVDQLEITGEVLEIGGHNLKQCSMNLFPEPKFRYHDLNIAESDVPNTIIADITDCRETIPDNSFDFIFSSDVFEHIDRPWLATQEIARILKPGGITVHHTLWSWRNHPCPIDYWRYSPECLEFLFNDLEVMEKGYDLSQRRVDQPGAWPSGNDSVPVDQFGGWREHWSVYIVARKGEGPAVPRFKDGDHPLAVHLRRDTQGTITNPRLLKQEVPTTPPVPAPAPAGPTVASVTEARRKIEELTGQIKRLEDQVTALSASGSKIAELTSQTKRLEDQVTALATVEEVPPLHRRIRRSVGRAISGQ